MIKKKKTQKQTQIWISTQEIKIRPQSGFYSNLNQVFDTISFEKKVRTLCEPFYSDKANVRPPVDPVVYFKMLFVGFFENIRSERGICARCDDSITIREFLGYSITEATPDHSTLSVIRRRLPESVFAQVFTIILAALKDNGLLIGKNIAFDSSIIEANASLGALTNRMTQESYNEYINGLAAEAGVDTKDKAAVARFDRKRPGRKTSNDEWSNPHDPDAKIGRTKHGAPNMVYKPEHAVDIDTGAIVDVNMLPGDQPDYDKFTDRIVDAQIRINDVYDDPTSAPIIETVTSDKGYFKFNEIKQMQDIEIMPVIPDFIEYRNLNKLNLEEKIALGFAKSEVKSASGRAKLKRRGMYVERSFAHVLDSGGQRRTTLRGNENILKRHRVATACYNLSLLMRKIFGFGTPKQLIAAAYLSVALLFVPILCLRNRFTAIFNSVVETFCQISKYYGRMVNPPNLKIPTFSTGS